MKTLRFLPLFLLLLLFSSCFDTVEEFRINDDGSGAYTMKFDMYRMIDLVLQMDPASADKEEFQVRKDSSFQFASLVDTSSLLTAEEKALYRRGEFNMIMDVPQKEFFFRMQFPYSQREDLEKIYKGSSRMMQVMSEGREEETEEPGSDMFSPGKMGEGMPSTAEMYEIVNKPGIFVRKSKTQELKNYLENDSTLQMMAPMLQGANMITVVHLPRPLKKCDNRYAELSDAKKTVTIKVPFEDYMKDPSKLDFEISY